MVNLFTLFVFLWTSFFTSVSYVQTSEIWTSNIPTYEELQIEEWKDILEPALSRLLYSTSDWEYKWTWKYYIHHMQKLKREWIITNENPNMTEKRWNVM